MAAKERIMAYLREHGSITQAEATAELGCSRLGARILDLKRAGHDIRKSMETGINRFGETTRYARYFLKEEKDASV